MGGIGLRQLAAGFCLDGVDVTDVDLVDYH